MPSRWILRLAIITVAIGYALPTSAGELGEFLSSVARDTKRRNCWPEPFVYSDRAAYHQAIAVQVAAGWERQNLLSEFHFLQGGKELTEAGRMRVQWIVTEAPEAHRQVFVHRGNTQEETALRMATAQRFVAQSAYAGQSVAVLETTRTDDGWPADRINAVSVKAAASALEPKLMGSSGGAGSGGGGH